MTKCLRLAALAAALLAAACAASSGRQYDIVGNAVSPPPGALCSNTNHALGGDGRVICGDRK